MHQLAGNGDAALRPVQRDRVSRAVAALLEGSAAPDARLFRLVAHSAPAVKALATQIRAAARMRLSPRLRHAIALRVAELNGCERCLVPPDGSPPDTATARRYRRGLADDPKEQALLALATKLVLERGHHTRCAVEAARQLGAGDAEIVEVTALVGLHTFANYLENVAG
ncbi:MAG: carboxymuconolactone decarboxylase family protein [Planctomycetota bacterium]